MESVAILGANSLIGQHLINVINLYELKSVNAWEAEEKFNYRLDDNNNTDLENVSSFVGFEALEEAISNVDIVFNLYEAQDFSLIPDEQLIEEKNVAFIRLLTEKCKALNVTKLVQLSSIYIQCSARWPNIGGREELNFEKFRKEVPFPVYCKSKYEAEQILLNASDKINSVCARVGPIYGEGDLQSLICDAILLSKHVHVLPRIGDKDGTLQMTYAGNVAYALLKCSEKLFTSNDITTEIVLIHDDTPIQNFYELALKPLSCKNDDKDDLTESVDDEQKHCDKHNHSLKISDRFISFYVFYPIYFLLCIFAWLWTKIINRRAFIAKIPSPYYAYLVFHHWTFYSDFKLRIFFEFSPMFNYATSLQRSVDYYRHLDIDRIKNFSWLP